jgi:hypothetical protein
LTIFAATLDTKLTAIASFALIIFNPSASNTPIESIPLSFGSDWHGILVPQILGLHVSAANTFIVKPGSISTDCNVGISIT